MVRLCTAAAWILGCLAVNLAILCPLATPQQTGASDYDCATCCSGLLEPAYSECIDRCEDAYSASCGECHCLTPTSSPTTYGDCMTNCQSFAASGCAGTACNTPARRCDAFPNGSCPAGAIGKSKCANGSPTRDCSGCACSSTHPFGTNCDCQ